jgi:hypothetical protein
MLASAKCAGRAGGFGTTPPADPRNQAEAGNSRQRQRDGSLDPAHESRLARWRRGGFDHRSYCFDRALDVWTLGQFCQQRVPGSLEIEDGPAEIAQQISALWQLVVDRVECLRDRVTESAIGLAAEAVMINRVYEPAHRQIIQAHKMADRAGAAERQYRLLCAVLGEELGVGPDRETIEIMTSPKLPRLAASLQPAASPESETPSRPTALEQGMRAGLHQPTGEADHDRRQHSQPPPLRYVSDG